MKIIKIIAAILIVAVCSQSCQKNNSVPSQVTSSSITDNAKLSEFLTISSIDAQKTAYRLLGSSEKYLVWTDHFKKFENSPALTSGQKEVVKGFMNIISPAFFENDNIANSEAFAILEYKMKQVFDKGDMLLIFGSFKNNKSELSSPVTLVAPVNPPVPPPSTPTCGCDYADDWCLGTSYCGGSTGDCSETPSGCGTLLRKACDGLCKDYVPL